MAFASNAPVIIIIIIIMEPSVSCSAPGGPPPMMEPLDAPNRIGKMSYLIDQLKHSTSIETGDTTNRAIKLVIGRQRREVIMRQRNSSVRK